ncbi:MAG TPA: SMP-30/gluconolactonase/LRE family protein [Bryobacteraceae bacterium]|nr:SMP-30/gluconolactonase/LRE family protein [Bryobacteraceae bacterium]
MRIALLLASACLCWAADFEVVDEAAFGKMFPSGAKVERLATEMKFTEGPAWMTSEGGFLVFSDIPANELKRWDPKKGVTTYRQPSNNTNGNTLDLDGRLLSAEHGGRRVSRTERNGEVIAVVDSHQGKKLNSPNDVVVKSDGTIWFTDPDYGLAGRPKEQEGNYVFRFDPRQKSLTPVIKDFDKPNGLCFSPDESKLYVADSGKPRHIRVFHVGQNGTLSGGEVFASIDKGGPDGIRCDMEGRIWSSSGDGAQIFSPDGKLLARILLPEAAANLTFGGSNGQRLFLTARTSVYAVETKTRMATGKKP